MNELEHQQARQEDLSAQDAMQHGQTEALVIVSEDTMLTRCVNRDTMVSQNSSEEKQLIELERNLIHIKDVLQEHQDLVIRS